MQKILLSILLLLVCGVCYSQKQTRNQYIAKYSDIAVREMKRVGIPASITLAQGILESGDGNSSLAVKANNHFGIKCHKDWVGESMYHDDDRPNECFRAYKNAEQSFVDHSEFLCTHSRYAFLFDYGTTDYKKWAKGLKTAGYATSRTYAEKLIEIIEANNLQRFDSDIIPETTPEKQTELATKNNSFIEIDVQNMEIAPFGDIKTCNKVDYVEAQVGDDIESVAKRYGMEPWQIRVFNELDANVKIVAGQRLYIQRKRNRAEAGCKTHIVSEGETMYDLAQKYAVRLKVLYKLNLMQEGTQPSVGDVIQLRKRVKKK